MNRPAQTCWALMPDNAEQVHCLHRRRHQGMHEAPTPDGSAFYVWPPRLIRWAWLLHERITVLLDR